MKKAIVYLIISSILSLTVGCASNPSSMSPNSVSSLAYDGKKCADLNRELMRVEQDLSAKERTLRKLHGDDVWQFWVGLLLLWPAWFFLEFGDHALADEYKTLLGERDALQRAKLECSA